MRPNTVRLLFWLALTSSLSPIPLRAAAWTQKQGHGQLIVNLSFLDTSEYRDPSSRKQSFSDRGSFRKFEINPYFEYGVTDRTTVVVNTLIPVMRYKNDWASLSSGGLGDTEVGVRHRLNGESPTVVSGQLSVQVPLYSGDRTPPPGNHQVDIESRLLIGRSWTIAGRHTFEGGGLAYRLRTAAPADQIRTDFTAGIDLTPRFTAMAQYFGITGLRNGSPVRAGGNPNVQSDFDLYKAQFSLVTRASRRTRVQLGWITTLQGRNTGTGNTVIASIWWDF